MTQFYLHLPSNSSTELFLDNTLTSYVTKLQDLISLMGEWEVALTKISLPLSWKPLPENGEKDFMVIHHLYQLSNHTNVHFSDGVDRIQYDTIEEILEALNRRMIRTADVSGSIVRP